MLEEGALDKIYHELPKTIQDCIELVRKIRGRYLWIDSLCVIQDDGEAKHIQITRMAQIYNLALLTIAAASTVDVNSGIPKLPCSNLVLLDRGSSPGNTNGSIVPLVQGTKYITRAWTFQERFLSRRCLYILSGQIMITCKSGIWGRGWNSIDWVFDHQREAREVFLRTEFGFDEFFKKDECVRATIVTPTSFINVSGTNVEYRYDSDEIDFAIWTVKRCLRHE